MRSRSFDRRCWSVLLLLVILLQPGCVRRRLTVRTDTPGALVSIDQQEIGTTPVSDYFTFYGGRNITVSKDGYETVQVSRNFKAPWYQWPVIEFFAENLWPFEIRDERFVDIQLVPKKPTSTAKLVKRGAQLRESAQTGLVLPLPDAEAAPAADPTVIQPYAGGFSPPVEIITPPPR